ETPALARAVQAPSSAIAEVDSANFGPAHAAPATQAIDGASIRRAAASLRAQLSGPDSSFSRFLGELGRELRRPSGAAGPTRWNWPEWIAASLLASVCLGLTRLGLGIVTIQRLRRRSVPVADRDFLDEVEILRAEFSCARKVEARETAELLS